MFRFFRCPKFVPFVIRSIGDRWARRSVNFSGRQFDLVVRKVPENLVRRDYPMVGMLLSDRPLSAREYEQWTIAVQHALEMDGRTLLVISDFDSQRAAWYAYASARETLQDVFEVLKKTHAVKWGINEDERWDEYEFCCKLANI